MKRTFFSALLALMMVFALVVSVSAATGEFVYDDADLLTRSEESALSRKLEQISDACDAQIVVVTVSEANMDPDVLLELVYDSMDFGYGDRRDGVLLLVSMDPREYRILSNGYCGRAIDPHDIEDIGDAIVSDLSGGDYADAFDTFADQCAYYLDGYINGFPFDFGGNLMICLIIGVVVGLVVALILMAQLKTVRSQSRAHEYIKSGSMNIRIRNDIYLYRNVSRTRKESGGSSRSSGGGGSRSTGGGSF